MKNQAKLILTSLFLLTACIIPSPVNAQAFGSGWGNCLEGGSTSTGGGVATVPTIQCLEPLFENVLGIMLHLIGIGAFIMIIVSGFRYLTSSGDPQAMEAAGATFKYAVGGLFGIFIVWFILVFIADFTGVDVLNFTTRLP